MKIKREELEKNLERNEKIVKVNSNFDSLIEKKNDFENPIDLNSIQNSSYDETERKIGMKTNNQKMIINTDTKKMQSLDNEIIKLNSLIETNEFGFIENERNKKNNQTNFIFLGENKLFEPYE